MTRRTFKRLVAIALVGVVFLYAVAASWYIVKKGRTVDQWVEFSSKPSNITRSIAERVSPPEPKPDIRFWERGEEWRRYPRNPVLSNGADGAWDDRMAAFASVMRDGGEIRMYYSGKDQAGRGQIGLALSADGKEWTKHPANPVLRLGEPGQWDDTDIWCPTVWKEGGEYRMLYTGRSADGVLQIGYATSADGISWTKHPANPVFNDPTWAHDHTEGFGLIKVGDEYLLWYNTLYVSTRQTGLARSTDLLHWTPVGDGPLFVHARGTGRHHQFCASPFRFGEFFYVMVPSQDKTRDFATIDLYRCRDPYFAPTDRQFVKQVLMPGPTGQWDHHDLDTAILLTDDITRSTFYRDQFWLYYSGEGGESIWRQGLAVEPDIERALYRPPAAEPETPPADAVRAPAP